jgi:hypothetical protein
MPFGKVFGGQNVHFKLQIFVISICTFLNFFIIFPFEIFGIVSNNL